LYCPEKHSLTKKHNLYVQAYSEALEKLIAICVGAPQSVWEI